MKSKLKIYNIGFSPIESNGHVLPPRKVLVIAQSEDQAKKHFRDWMVLRKKQNYFFVSIEKVNKTSKLAKDMLKPYSIEERYDRQNDWIYNGVKHDTI